MPPTPRKLNKISDDSYAKLTKRLTSVPISWDTIFPQPVSDFISNKAKTFSACYGYFVGCLLAVTSYVTGLTSNLAVHQGVIKPNLYILLNGPPTTSKSAAIKETCVQPLRLLSENFPSDLTGLTMQNVTSSAMTKHLAKNKRGMLISPEIFDLLRKLIKSDIDSATGDISLLCSLFSGEEVTIGYATENDRHIPSNTPFCILGAIQTPASTKLFSMLDNGQGLVDRLLFLSPMPIRPTPAQTKEALDTLKDSPISDFTQVIQEIYSQHEVAKNYKLDQEAATTMNAKEEQFISAINEAILAGQPTPKNKTTDQIYRVALAIHVLTNTISALLNKQKPSIPTDIPNDCILKATTLVEYAEAQKEVMMTFIDSILATEVAQATPDQPDQADIKQAILQCPGPVVTQRSFKCSARPAVRHVTGHEIFAAMKDLSADYGEVHSIKLRGQGRTSIVFVKKHPDTVDKEDIMPKEQFKLRYKAPIPSSIGATLKKHLQDNGIINEPPTATRAP